VSNGQHRCCMTPDDATLCYQYSIILGLQSSAYFFSHPRIIYFSRGVQKNDMFINIRNMGQAGFYNFVYLDFSHCQNTQQHTSVLETFFFVFRCVKTKPQTEFIWIRKRVISEMLWWWLLWQWKKSWSDKSCVKLLSKICHSISKLVSEFGVCVCIPLFFNHCQMLLREHSCCGPTVHSA